MTPKLFPPAKWNGRPAANMALQGSCTGWGRGEAPACPCRAQERRDSALLGDLPKAQSAPCFPQHTQAPRLHTRTRPPGQVTSPRLSSRAGSRVGASHRASACGCHTGARVSAHTTPPQTGPPTLLHSPLQSVLCVRGLLTPEPGEGGLQG